MIEHLPPGNAVEREELGNAWTDTQWILHSIDSQLRNLNASFYNANKPKGKPAVTPTYLPTPDPASTKAGDHRTPEQIQAERDHLQAVLNRPKPT